MWCRSLAEFPAQQSQPLMSGPESFLGRSNSESWGLSETARSSAQCKFKSAVRHVHRERATEGSSWRWRRKVSGDVEGGDGIGLRDPGNQRQRKDDQG